MIAVTFVAARLLLPTVVRHAGFWRPQDNFFLLFQNQHAVWYVPQRECGNRRQSNHFCALSRWDNVGLFSYLYTVMSPSMGMHFRGLSVTVARGGERAVIAAALIRKMKWRNSTQTDKTPS